MRISGFVHGITNPELIKRFHEKIPKIVDEMMQVATSFLQGQEATSNQERKKAPPAWKHSKRGHRQNFKKGGGFRSQHKQEKRPDRKQIEDILKAGKLSHIIRELKQSSGKDQPKKKGETSEKEKPRAILMIQSRQKVIRKNITQSFSPNPKMLFPSLRGDEGAEGPLIIEAEIGGHQVHRICIDGGSSFEILHEHCFNRLRPEIKNQMVIGTDNTLEKSRVKLCNLLQQSLDIFAWTPADMTGVPRHIVEHRLNVREGYQPVRQKKRGQAAERNIAINDKVSKLVAAGIMREVHYHD
ncbi:hypothetical protein Tco_1212103 [Tanacetum coccineum]